MDDFWNEISNVIPSSSGILSNLDLDLDLDLDSVLVDEISSDNTIGDKRIRPFSVEQPKEKIQKIEEFNPDSIFDFDDDEEEPLVSEEIHPIKENSTLVPISKLGNQYKNVFPYEYLNEVQSKSFQLLFNTSHNTVITAPTGSGKTGLLELSICHELKKSTKPLIIYLAPLKALCHERYLDWNEKFSSLNLKCQELTGDYKAGITAKTNLVITTPEKWDLYTRNMQNLKSVMQRVKLVLIDEVQHLSEDRGATLEAIICRMMLIEVQNVRYVAVSATCPNAYDIGEWLNCDLDNILTFGQEYRPVKLTTIVKGFPPGKNDFLFQQNLKYKVFDIIRQYYDSLPTLVFCSTRKETYSTVQQILKDAITYPDSLILSPNQRTRLAEATIKLSDKQLKEFVPRGIGFYHAGLSVNDRNIIQDLFYKGQLVVVCTTSSLAKGVNLPAHLVIIQGTQIYNGGIYEEISIIDVLQMIGRAGRPQFDTKGTAVIMTKDNTTTRYSNLINGQEMVESHLMKSIPTFLNTEISIGTIRSIRQAQCWINSTFMFKRILSNPSFYNIPTGLSKEKLDVFMKRMLMCALQDLKSSEMVKIKEDGILIPLEAGICMTKYSIAFETMKLFNELNFDDIAMIDILLIFAKASEFSQITLRRNEKSCLNELHQKVKYPLLIQGKKKAKLQLIKTPQDKIFVLIQALLGDINISEWSLKQEATLIISNLKRITKGAICFFLTKPKKDIIHNIILFSQSINQKLWYDSPLVCKQIDKIGVKYASKLAEHGITSFESLEKTDPRMIEEYLSRNIPFGNKVLESLKKIWPKHHLQIEFSNNKLNIKIISGNSITRSRNSSGNYSTLLVSEESTKEVYFSQNLVPNFTESPFEVSVDVKGESILCELFSNDFIGMNITQTINISNKNTIVESKYEKSELSCDEIIDEIDSYLDDEVENITPSSNTSFRNNLQQFSYNPSKNMVKLPKLDSNNLEDMINKHQLEIQEEKKQRAALERRIIALENQIVQLQSNTKTKTGPCTPHINSVPEIPLHPEGRATSKWYSLAKQHSNSTKKPYFSFETS